MTFQDSNGLLGPYLFNGKVIRDFLIDILILGVNYAIPYPIAST